MEKEIEFIYGDDVFYINIKLYGNLVFVDDSYDDVFGNIELTYYDIEDTQWSFAEDHNLNEEQLQAFKIEMERIIEAGEFTDELIEHYK